ncbi:hypothetical protein CU098_004235 [Rhizopus stolonifer]|uniref:Reverse transcriptase domain-containing protein n=1 Tax=Rhizopus stolonifer TaxID=4846 RepID=A0A367JW45_RHIST|nr:hypothetical protein CU098_004235 [Rhizopus stolonifer]
MASHLETIFNGSLLPAESSPFVVTISPAPHDEMLPLDLDDVTSAIQKLLSRKAPGVDHIRVETLITPALAFLDIKSAYDTVDHNVIWCRLQPTVSPALLALLQNMFNDISIEVLLSNTKSYSFTPRTGVLQDMFANDLITSINCLLYVDDVVLIATKETFQPLLDQCTEHSLTLGY